MNLGTYVIVLMVTSFVIGFMARDLIQDAKERMKVKA